MNPLEPHKPQISIVKVPHEQSLFHKKDFAVPPASIECGARMTGFIPWIGAYQEHFPGKYFEKTTIKHSSEPASRPRNKPEHLKRTPFEVQTYTRDGDTPVFVVRESINNYGPSLERVRDESHQAKQ